MPIITNTNVTILPEDLGTNPGLMITTGFLIASFTCILIWTVWDSYHNPSHGLDLISPSELRVLLSRERAPVEDLESLSGPLSIIDKNILTPLNQSPISDVATTALAEGGLELDFSSLFVQVYPSSTAWLELCQMSLDIFTG